MIFFTLLFNLLFGENYIYREPISIYIARVSWHVGIIMPIDENSIRNITALNSFKDFNFVDIGWGDAEFYQSEDDFDIYLAAKAIILPTSSVVRIRGYNYEIDSIFKWRDFVIEINLSQDQYNALCKFINDAFIRNSSDQLVISSQKLNGMIKFYESIHQYYIGYTCNTWVADALENSGLDIESSNVITADELLVELLKVGIIRKLSN